MKTLKLTRKEVAQVHRVEDERRRDRDAGFWHKRLMEFSMAKELTAKGAGQ